MKNKVIKANIKANIKAAKEVVKNLAKEYQLKVKWQPNPNTGYINVWVNKKVEKVYHVLWIELDEAKIAYGSYKPMLVKYNVERQIRAWLKSIQ